MEIRIGPPVSGDDYFRRPALEERLTRSLRRNHVSLLAPRRTGKTSLLTRLRDSSPENELRCLINLEKCLDPASWMTAMLQPLTVPETRWGEIGQRVKRALDKLDGIEIPAAGRLKFRKDGWEAPAAQVLEMLEALKSPVVFLLDEFPILVSAMARADPETCRSALHWFREWRQRTADGPVRFLVTGSIGLEPVVKRYDLWDTVNDFTDRELPPLSAEEAGDLLRQLLAGAGIELPAPLLKYAVAKLEPPWPYFVQLIAGGLEETLDVGEAGAVPSEDLIDRVYRDEIVAGPRNKYTVHMWERLKRIFDAREQPVARVLLREASRSDAGLSRDQIEAIAAEALPGDDVLSEEDLLFVLDVLKHDAYLRQDVDGDQRTRFFSAVLRDYWIRRYA